ncbi:helix-turn-helix domain-containing protein [Micromonospora sp. WMMD710]|uniref:winged helix-turn-helix transcriptional regulator n=1 Tax=Micromonospora sp. WMMD710 TaxID=3016085 RepID=UPI0024166C3F|nr:helix-turn-helix domain-containing protein [Micromonospora sp. WMMD710]MDG4758564.1 helix-turn-helix domain-containing protein [Micromonospora sp. WMMD710]
MSRRGYGQDCSIARALEVVGERWTLLIVRNALVGDCRFDSFLSDLGMARNVLAQRLNTLVEAGIFERVPYKYRPLRHEYRLTARGRDLAPVLMALMQWGDKHSTGAGQPERASVHTTCEHPVELVVMCTSCGGPVPVDEMATRPTTSSSPVPEQGSTMDSRSTVQSVTS